MKRFLIIFASLMLNFISHAQTGIWSGWTTTYQENGKRVQISFKLSTCYPVGGESVLHGYSFYRINNEFQREKEYVYISFQYINCDGSQHSETVNVSLANSGINEDMGYHFQGRQITGQITYEYKSFNTTATTTNTGSGSGYSNGISTSQNNNQVNQQQSQNQAQQQERARREQLQGQLNQLQQNYQNNTQRIEELTSAFAGVIGVMQNNMIQKSVNTLNSRREEKFNNLKSQLQQSGGTLDPCHSCSGSGAVSCPTCNGNPVTTCNYCGGNGKMVSFGTTMSCSTCGGTGKNICSLCGGAGYKLCYDCFGAGYTIISGSQNQYSTQSDNSVSYSNNSSYSNSSNTNNQLYGMAEESAQQLYEKGEQAKSKDLQKAYEYWKSAAKKVPNFLSLTTDQVIETNNLIEAYTLTYDKAALKNATIEAWKKAIFGSFDDIYRIGVMTDDQGVIERALDMDNHIKYTDRLWNAYEFPNELLYAASLDKFKNSFLKRASLKDLDLLQSEYIKRKKQVDYMSGQYTFKNVIDLYKGPEEGCGKVTESTGIITIIIDPFLTAYIRGDIKFSGSRCKNDFMANQSNSKTREVSIHLDFASEFYDQDSSNTGLNNFSGVSNYYGEKNSSKFCLSETRCWDSKKISSASFFPKEREFSVYVPGGTYDNNAILVFTRSGNAPTR